MSEIKHTPGPWHTHIHGGQTDGGYVAISTEDDLWIAEAKGRGHLRHTMVGPRNDDEIQANANLIAAAPDLLDALQDLLDEQNDAPLERHRKRWDAAIEKASAALNKAKGIQP